MSRCWDRILRLDDKFSIWVEEEELGKEKLVQHRDKGYRVKIPEQISKKKTLRLRGIGKTRFGKTGDLFLQVWLNKGEDVRMSLWLSETCARNGAEKKLFTGEKMIKVLIPKGSYHGPTIRLRGLGGWPSFGRDAPALDQVKRGSLLVKLIVYPDHVTPRYGSFDFLSTEHMALEGWVYRKFDEVVQKLGETSLPVNPMRASTIADLFNEAGLLGIFDELMDHLQLPRSSIVLKRSVTLPTPGRCERTPKVHNNELVGYDYTITINEKLSDNPFSIAAILAHELCHVVYIEKIDDAPMTTGYVIKSEKATLEEERTVDLLVFMFKMGEFQLRVARDKSLTIGYFDQEVFERIQVIVSKKLDSFHRRSTPTVETESPATTSDQKSNGIAKTPTENAMQAIVQNDYGSEHVLELKKVDKPEVTENEVLVSVHAAALNAGDVFCTRGSPWVARFRVGFPKPKDYIPGYDVAGCVEAIGQQVTQFQPGDEVFAACSGALAEFVCVAEDELALKPTNLSFVQAAVVPNAALTALQGLRDAGKLQWGQKVLINGASGGVGTFAVQIAKSFGAEVTGVCSTRNLDMVLSIGADRVIDYTQEDFTQGGGRYDLILDNVANHSFSDLRRALTPQGVIISNSGHGGMGHVLKAFFLSVFMRQLGGMYLMAPNQQDLVVLKDLIEAGKMRPVIDRTFPLTEVPGAIRYLAESHARGKVAIRVKESSLA